MDIETRAKGGTHYYRKVREGGRVRSVYVASGEAAEALADLDQKVREAAKLRKETPIEEPAGAEIVAAVEAYCDDVTAVLRGHLEAHGYHRHKRGEWRKRR